MVHKKGGNRAVFLLIVLAIATIFLVQIPLPEVTIQAEIPKGADVAVIGGTTAAILSALKAAEDGAQVFLFPNGQELAEDSSFLVNGGLALAESPLQQELGIEFDSQLFEEKLKEHGGALNDPALLKAFFAAQVHFYGWIKDAFGLSFNSLPRPETHPYLHSSTLPNNALLFKQSLLANLRNSPVIVRQETVKELLFSPQGQLEAILLGNVSESEEDFPFYIRAAILADGGYNEDLLREHNNFPADNILFNLRPNQQGKGLKMAADLGLEIIQMGFQNTHLLLYNPLAGEYCFLPADPWEETYFINTKGQILSWEGSSLFEAVNFVVNSPPGGSFVLAPHKRAETFGQFFRRFEQLEQLSQYYQFESLPQFPRTPAVASPFYVAPLRVGIDYMLGGLAVTPRGEVKKDGLVVKGLYAAGEIVGGLHGEALLPGMALSETLFLAQIAGESAAQYSRR